MESAESSGRSPSGSSHRSLIRQAIDGDAESWRRIAAIFGPTIYSWVRQAGLDPHDAADVGQEVLRTVYQRIAEFQQFRAGGFRNWLRAITRNKVGDFFRRQGRRIPTTSLPTDETLAASEPSQSSEPGEPGGPSEIPPDARQAGQALAGSEASERCSIVRRACLAIQGEFAPRIWQAFWRSVVDQQPSDQIADELQMTRHAVRQARYRVLRRLREELDGLLD
jgi:RNA polymerase sigma-70 factor (ECF subfamily)